MNYIIFKNVEILQKKKILKRPRFCEGKYWICNNILFVEMKIFKINIIQ
jgi:hypothetical protein